MTDTCVPSAPAIPQLDVDAAFAALTNGLVLVEERSLPKKKRITVMIDLPHLARYGRDTTRELVYGCNFPVKVGDLVLCPPTPRQEDGSWNLGMVTALDGGHYRGRVKHVAKASSKKRKKQP